MHWHRARRTLVAALCAAGLAAVAPGVARAADTTPPTEPGTIAVANVTATSASLSWGRSTDDTRVEGYRVYRGAPGATAAQMQLIATTDAVTSYSATKLYSARGYQFGVTAIDLAGNESPMRTTTLTTASSSDTTAPAAPSSSSVSAKAFSSSRIDVLWGTSGSSDVAGYQVFRDGTRIATVDLPNGLHVSDNGLAAGSAHSYAIRAVDSAGNVSAATTGRSATTLASGTVRIARGPYVSNVTGTSAVVSWWTNLPTAGVVTWGGGSATDPAGSVRHHRVAIGGLSPGSTVSYQVGDGGSTTSSGSFRTAAPAGGTFSFAAIGDFGGGSPGESQNAANIAAAGTSFIQTAGDNIYPSAGNPDPDFATVYSDFDGRFFKQFGTAIRSQALFPANGNKEYYDFGTFWDAFPMPGDNHAWYSYDWGDAHILVLDSEQPFSTGTPQYDFAQADLSAHQGATWRIVALQRPPYSSSSANASSKPVQQYLVPLFQAEHVQLVLSGNSHNYERSYPLIDGAPAAGGITYVVTGAGGNGFNKFTLAQPAWSAFREASSYEFLKVSVSPSAIALAAIRSSDGAVIDSATIAAGGSGGSGGSTSTTLAPTDDAAIDQTNATTNYGSGSKLTVDGSPVIDSLVRFSVPSTCTSVASAKLTLTVGGGTNNDSAKGGDVYLAASSAWSEGTVTWSTAPAKSGSAVASFGPVALNTSYTVDVSQAVTGPGPVSFRLSTTSGDAAAYLSKEGSATAGPRLAVTC